MSTIEKLLLIFCCTYLLIVFSNFFTGGRTFKKIDKIIENYRKKKHPQLFSYINFYNKLADSYNEIYKKEYLPISQSIDSFYDNIRYLSSTTIKNTLPGIEQQKQLLEKANEDMRKVWSNAQEYYELIEEYTKTHKILWVNEYLEGFYPL